MNNPIDPAETTPAPDDRALDDDRLLAWLGEALREADPPPDLSELARQSFRMRNLDAELAALVEDSLETPSALAVRGWTVEPRQLTFELEDELVIAVQVENLDGRRRLTGHLAPQGAAHIEVRQPAVPRARGVDADRRGLFVIDDVFPGPMSLTCRRTGAPAVATQWTLV